MLVFFYLTSQTGVPLAKSIDNDEVCQMPVFPKNFFINFGKMKARYKKYSVTSLFLRKLLLVSMLYGTDIYKIMQCIYHVWSFLGCYRFKPKSVVFIL